MSKRKPIGRLIGASPIVDGEVRSSGVISTGEASGSIGAFDINNALRFDGSGDYLRSGPVSASNRNTVTFSAWVRLTGHKNYNYFLSTYWGGTTVQQAIFYVDQNGSVGMYHDHRPNNTEKGCYGTSDNVLTVGEWHHVVCVIDTTQSNANDMVAVWVDGTKYSVGNGLTAGAHGFGSAFTTTDYDTVWNIGTWEGTSTGQTYVLAGRVGDHNPSYTPDNILNGQMAEVHFVDGQALDPTYFGEYNSDNVWVPKEVTGIDYGNNGFYLDFKGNDTGVTLLLDGESSTIADVSNYSGSSNVTLPSTYKPVQNTSVKKFGTGSIEFSKHATTSANDSYLTFTPGALSGDFTVECWFRPKTIGTTTVDDMLIWDSRLSGDTSRPVLYMQCDRGASAKKMQFLSGGNVITATTTAEIGIWMHIAVVRNNGECKLFINGMEEGTSITDTDSFSADTHILGRRFDQISGEYYGTDAYIDDFRFTKGYARYTDSFTPPISALTNTPEYLGDFGVDRTTDGTGVTLLLDGESYTDQSTYPLTVDETGGDNAMSLNTTTYKFGSSSYYFGDDTATSENRLYVQDTSLAMGTGDFTYECWIYPTHANDDSIFETRSSGATGISDGFTLTAITTTSVRVWSGGAARITSGTISNLLNNWHHVAVVRNNGTTELFVDGASQGTTTYSMNCTNDDIIIGMGRYAGSTAIAGGIYGGYIDDFRITRGVARYSGSFIPTSSLSADVSGITGSDDVTLLLDGSSNTTDASENQTISETGNVTPVTATGHPYATSSLDFDTSVTSYLRTGTTADFKFGTDPFTIEFWMKPDTIDTSASNAGYSTIMENESGSTITGSWFAVHQLHGEIYFGVNSGVNSITTSSSGISTTFWSHVAIVRDSSNICTIYVDGVSKGSATISHNLTDANSRTLVIGKQLTFARRYDGQLTDIRITKGAALYPFHPPISALTNDDTWDKPKNDFSVEGNITPDDQLLDTPNLRFATLDPDDIRDMSTLPGTGDSLGNGSLSEGNYQFNDGSDVRYQGTTFSTLGKSSGKWYVEFHGNGRPGFGLYDGVRNSNDLNHQNYNNQVNQRTAINGPGRIWTPHSSSLFRWDYPATVNANTDYNTNINSSYGTTWVSGDIVGMAFDLGNGTIEYFINGTSQGQAFSDLNSSYSSGNDWYVAVSDVSNTTDTYTYVNFGQDHTFAGSKPTRLTSFSDANGNGEFYYQPPSGFLALAEIEKTKVNTVQRWNGLIGNSVARRTTGGKVIENSGIITTSEHYQSKL